MVTLGTVIGAEVAPVCVALFVVPPLLELHVAVWLTIALPLAAPNVKVTVSKPVVATVVADIARTPVGAAGGPAGEKLFDAADGELVPMTFVAETLQV